MSWVALIPALPAIAFAVLLPLSRRVRNRLVWLSVASIGASLLLSVAAFLQVWPGGHSEEPFWHVSAQIGNLSGAPLELGLRLDPIAAAMLLVALVGAVWWSKEGKDS